MRNFRLSFYILLSTTLLPLTFGCSRFGIDSDAKFSMLSNTRVFTNTDGGSSDAYGGPRNGELWPFQQVDGGSGSVVVEYDDGAIVVDENGVRQFDGGSGGFVPQPDGNGIGVGNPNANNDGGGSSAPNGVILGLPEGAVLQPDGSYELPNGGIVLPVADSPVDPEIRDMSGNEMIPVPGIPTLRICSDRRIESKNKKDNAGVGDIIPVLMANSLKLVITNMNDEIICENSDTQALLQNIKENRTLDLVKACGGSVVIPAWIYLLNEQNINLFDADKGTRPVKLDRKTPRRGLEILIADNPERDGYEIIELGDEDYALCDKMASPLFVDMRDVDYRDVGFELTSPLSGVLFDILGENAKPAPHTKKQISWFKNAAMAFIVLPDFNGNVTGINELFGDNTKGPDGKFASNGFTALAKYDGLPLPERMPVDLSQTYGPYWERIERTPDGQIDKNDHVYKLLKLWSDKNKDGIATSDELISLDEAGIEIIDLNYDPNFREVDEYGNQVKYKSAAKSRYSGLRLVFDVWFKLP